jgi:tRNA-binding protein
VSDEITLADLERVDLRAGRVVEARPLEDARVPAILMRIDFGPEIGVKRSSARITDRYAPEDLVGRLVVAVVNLPPRQVGKHLSEVLVTGFDDGSGRIALCAPDRDVPPGARLH